MALHKNSGINYLLFLFVLFLSAEVVYSQEETNEIDVFVSPRITIGYTFGTGLNCGFDLGIGVYRINDVMLGTNFSYYLVVTDHGSHRIKGITLSAETDYISGRLGLGMVSRKWGLRNVNKARTPGIMIDVSASADAYKAPWVGFKTFVFKRSKWLYYDLPTYTSTYAYFKSQDIEIYKEDSKNADE